MRLNDDPVYLKASAPIVAAEGIRGALVSNADRLHAGGARRGRRVRRAGAGARASSAASRRAAKIEEGERAMAEEFARLDSEQG